MSIKVVGIDIDLLQQDWTNTFLNWKFNFTYLHEKQYYQVTFPLTLLAATDEFNLLAFIQQSRG